jgi:hypothetical protein
LGALGGFLLAGVLDRHRTARKEEQTLQELSRIASEALERKSRHEALVLAVRPLAYLLDSSVVFSFYAIFSKVVQQWNAQHPEQQIAYADERFLLPLQLVLGHYRQITGDGPGTLEHQRVGLFFLCHDAQSIAQRFFVELQRKHATAERWPAALHEDYTKLRETWNELLSGWNRYCGQQRLDTLLVFRMPEIGSIGASD